MNIEKVHPASALPCSPHTPTLVNITLQAVAYKLNYMRSRCHFITNIKYATKIQVHKYKWGKGGGMRRVKSRFSGVQGL